ncbi:lmo0937 family membrane protein [Rhodocaloribacter litoris]|nr:lmo0937 family membrane protein [Rhodocaloribacter litoris]QXD15644.1 lmo0937 family membrane protein [Rhodocaloribacter litoris]
MLRLILVLLIVGWLLGFFVFDLGALLHLLLVVAVIVLIVDLVRGRPVV